MNQAQQNKSARAGQDTPTKPRHYGRRATDAAILTQNEVGNDFSGRRILAVIPAYNEERFIGSVVLKTCQVASTVIVVDDGSTDATAQIASAAGAVVVRRTQNQGKGAALNTGFQVARDYLPDAVSCWTRTASTAPRRSPRWWPRSWRGRPTW